MTTKHVSAHLISRYPLCQKYGLTLLRVSHRQPGKVTPYYVTSVAKEDLLKMIRGKGADWCARFWENCPDEDYPSANDVEHVLIMMERGARA